MTGGQGRGLQHGHVEDLIGLRVGRVAVGGDVHDPADGVLQSSDFAPRGEMQNQKVGGRRGRTDAQGGDALLDRVDHVPVSVLAS